MQPRIEILPEKKLVGRKVKMSLTNNTTLQLFQSFMPQRNEIKNSIGNDIFCLQTYNDSYFDSFNLNAEFEKWAAKEVAEYGTIPFEMEPLTLNGGLYAVFLYKGLSTDHKIFEYIYGTWLPASEYLLDNRPHFEILGEKFKNNDPNSEEEIWIPIKLKN